jgi:hypothetical protein
MSKGHIVFTIKDGGDKTYYGRHMHEGDDERQKQTRSTMYIDGILNDNRYLNYYIYHEPGNSLGWNLKMINAENINITDKNTKEAAIGYRTNVKNYTEYLGNKTINPTFSKTEEKWTIEDTKLFVEYRLLMRDTQTSYKDIKNVLGAQSLINSRENVENDLYTTKMKKMLEKWDETQKNGGDDDDKVEEPTQKKNLDKLEKEFLPDPIGGGDEKTKTEVGEIKGEEGKYIMWEKNKQKYYGVFTSDTEIEAYAKVTIPDTKRKKENPIRVNTQLNKLLQDLTEEEKKEIIHSHNDDIQETLKPDFNKLKKAYNPPKDNEKKGEEEEDENDEWKTIIKELTNLGLLTGNDGFKETLDKKDELEQQRQLLEYYVMLNYGEKIVTMEKKEIPTKFTAIIAYKKNKMLVEKMKGEDKEKLEENKLWVEKELKYWKEKQEQIKDDEAFAKKLKDKMQNEWDYMKLLEEKKTLLEEAPKEKQPPSSDDGQKTAKNEDEQKYVEFSIGDDADKRFYGKVEKGDNNNDNVIYHEEDDNVGTVEKKIPIVDIINPKYNDEYKTNFDEGEKKRQIAVEKFKNLPATTEAERLKKEEAERLKKEAAAKTEAEAKKAEEGGQSAEDEAAAKKRKEAAAKLEAAEKEKAQEAAAKKAAAKATKTKTGKKETFNDNYMVDLEQSIDGNDDNFKNIFYKNFVDDGMKDIFKQSSEEKITITNNESINDIKDYLLNIELKPNVFSNNSLKKLKIKEISDFFKNKSKSIEENTNKIFERKKQHESVLNFVKELKNTDNPEEKIKSLQGEGTAISLAEILKKLDLTKEWDDYKKFIEKIKAKTPNTENPEENNAGSSKVEEAPLEEAPPKEETAPKGEAPVEPTKVEEAPTNEVEEAPTNEVEEAPTNEVEEAPPNEEVEEEEEEEVVETKITKKRKKKKIKKKIKKKTGGKKSRKKKKSRKNKTKKNN